MLLVIIVLSLSMMTVEGYRQNDYRIKHHRLEVVYFNPKFIRNVTICLAPINRTARAFNGSVELVADLKYNLVHTGQVYKFASNEYREFPLRMAIDACKEVEESRFGLADFQNHTNIRNCIPKKGSYYVKMYRPDETKFPPYLPGGDYKIAVNVTHGSDLVAEGHWYGSVQTIEKWLRIEI